MSGSRPSYVLSPRAQADLDEIWDFTAATWGETQAVRYARVLQQAVEAAAADPRLGRPADDIRPGYFRCPAGSHVLFFRLTGTGIDVVRILHKRMDFGRHLQGQGPRRQATPS